jgi:DNA polymerase-3 subunit delta
MLIKESALKAALEKKISPVYVLIGTESYLLEQAVASIKSTWRKQGDSEEKRLSLNLSADWSTLTEEAHSYSLFFDTVLIEASFEKKTIDALGKATLTAYLGAINPRCLILIRAPLLPSKQLSWLTANPHVTVVQITALTTHGMLAWITQQLKQMGLSFSEDIPGLIQQYTQGNQLACAQVLKKLAMVHAPGESITADDARAHLTDQCEYQLYELTDACLTGNLQKAMHIARLAHDNRTEPTHILWILTQEIRLLIQLNTKRSQGESFNQASRQLNIWPQREKNYETALNRLKANQLYALLNACQHVDEGIKTGTGRPTWQGIEQLILQLSAPMPN